MPKLLHIFTVGIVILVTWLIYSQFLVSQNIDFNDLTKELNPQINEGGPKVDTHPLQIAAMRKAEYPGSDITIEQTLGPGSNYSRYIASYQSTDSRLSPEGDKSKGLKIYALLTVPNGEKPSTGWPVIIFNHGYIAPDVYKTTERYIAYTDAFSRNGYIVLRSDYRGHDNSEGTSEGAYYSPAYTTDVLNAVSSIKKYQDADPNRIGMWGHSMGGHITLRSMVVSKDIKAGVIWAGVVASYYDLANNWRRTRPFSPSPAEQMIRRPNRQMLIDKYGNFDQNPKFWKSISPIDNINEISGPVQLHHGSADDEVPILFSQRLDEALKNANKTVEFYSYEGDDHNIGNNIDTALNRSVEFFDKYVKNTLN